ncbi:MAG: proline racemase [Ardenticatenales bacterium]|nr:proline racemase [Ardenticatenales bacterium]
MVQFTRILSTIDSHTAGEPTRLVVSGLPPLRGATMAEKMLYARREFDDIRALLMDEPRGRRDMYGALLTASSDPAADFGLIFMNTQQYTTMCGHAIMGAATAVIQTGMVPAVEPETIVVFETPVGLVQTQTRVQEGRAHEVALNNTPVFVHQLNAPLAVPELGELLVDIVYSGGFFILVAAARVGLELVPANAGALASLGAHLHCLANQQLSVQHPELPFMTAIDAVEFHGPAERQPDGFLLARNAAVFGANTVDRSPCGTGTGARMAALHARGQLQIAQSVISESIIGTRFTGQIVEETHVGRYPAIVPRVAGRAYLTGFHQFVLDPDDPFPHGFSLTEFEKALPINNRNDSE